MIKVPIVKEHGSWVVSGLSFAAGMIIGFFTSHGYQEPEIFFNVLLTFTGLAFLINSKSPLSSLIKRSGKENALSWFLFFAVGGSLLLMPFLFKGLSSFIFFSPIVILYVILLYAGKEHNLVAELTGFSLLTLSAPVAYFAAAGVVSYRLYLAVFIYYVAGIFEVRVKTRRRFSYRLFMVLYCLLALILYRFINVSVFVLLPLIENIFSAIWLREEKLKITGNIEFAKGIMFTAILVYFWL